ncbi:MAG: hypothetical protein ABW133_10020 [Polyangiaceae bacterium]
MKRTTKKKSRPSIPPRSPKLPDELHPIVDSVVEVVFERLRGEAQSQAAKMAPASRKTAKLNLPLPKQRTALAEALADLLLADLANRSRGAGKGKAKGKKAAAGSRQGGSPQRAAGSRPKSRAPAAKVRRGGARPAKKSSKKRS